MLKTFSLPAKLGAIGSVLLLMALASIGLTPVSYTHLTLPTSDLV